VRARSTTSSALCATGSASTTTCPGSSPWRGATRRRRGCWRLSRGCTRCGSPPWRRAPPTSRSANAAPSGSRGPASGASPRSWAHARCSTACPTWRFPRSARCGRSTLRHPAAMSLARPWSGSRATGSGPTGCARCSTELPRSTRSGCVRRRTPTRAVHCWRSPASARSPRTRSCCGCSGAPTTYRWRWPSSAGSPVRCTASPHPPRTSCASGTAPGSAGGRTSPGWGSAGSISRRRTPASAAESAPPTR